MLPHQVNDAPTAIALLEVGKRERSHLGASQTAAQEHGENGSVA
jgi:hypothetical protein